MPRMSFGASHRPGRANAVELDKQQIMAAARTSKYLAQRSKVIAARAYHSSNEKLNRML